MGYDLKESGVYDYIIIGGGLPGLFAARELLGYGYRVAVLDKDTICSGAVSRSAGIVSVQMVLRYDIKAVVESIKILEYIDRVYDRNVGIIRSRGMLSIATNARVLDRITMVLKSNNIPFKILYGDEMFQVIRDIRIRNNDIGILTDLDLVVNVSEICSYLRSEITSLGGRIYEGCSYIYLKKTQKNISIATSSNFNRCGVKGGFIILNTGAYTSETMTLSGIGPPIPRQIYYKCQLSSINYSPASDIPIVFDISTRAYLVKETRNRSIVGDGACKIIKHPDEGLIIDHDILYNVLNDLETRFVGIEKAKIISSWAFPCDTTPDLLPVIGKDPRYDNLYLIYGLSSYGVSRGPYLGIQIAKLASGKKADLELEILKPSHERDQEKFLCYELHTPIDIE